MHRLAAVLSLSALSLVAVAAPTSTAGDITVVFQHEKGTASKSLQVWNADETEFYAETCGTRLDQGPFAKNPIVLHTDDNGHGTLTYGSKLYIIHSKPEVSGGITCAKRYNGDHARVDCTVPAQDTYEDVAWYGLKSCFTSEEHERFGSIQTHLNPKNGWKQTPSFTGLPVSKNESEVLDKRIVLPPTCEQQHRTDLLNDGNPHQNYWNNQLSDNIHCESATACMVGETDAKSVTVGFTAEAVLDEWISGGFSVEVSWETGHEYQCQGATGDTVCIWYETAHTAYTVTNFDNGSCGSGIRSEPFVVFSPNSHNKGGLGNYCVVGPCRTQGEGYWNYNGPAGGPPQ